jgi:hypothetical protein
MQRFCGVAQEVDLNVSLIEGYLHVGPEADGAGRSLANETSS